MDEKGIRTILPTSSHMLCRAIGINDASIRSQSRSRFRRNASGLRELTVYLACSRSIRARSRRLFRRRRRVSRTLEGARNRECRLRHSVHAFLEAPDVGRSAVSDDGEQLDEAFLQIEKRFRLAESVLDEVTAAVGQDQGSARYLRSPGAMCCRCRAWVGSSSVDTGETR